MTILSWKNRILGKLNKSSTLPAWLSLLEWKLRGTFIEFITGSFGLLYSRQQPWKVIKGKGRNKMGKKIHRNNIKPNVQKIKKVFMVSKSRFKNKVIALNWLGNLNASRYYQILGPTCPAWLPGLARRTVIDTTHIDEPATNPCQFWTSWTSQDIDSYQNLFW